MFNHVPRILLTDGHNAERYFSIITGAFCYRCDKRLFPAIIDRLHANAVLIDVPPGWRSVADRRGERSRRSHDLSRSATIWTNFAVRCTVIQPISVVPASRLCSCIDADAVAVRVNAVAVLVDAVAMRVDAVAVRVDAVAMRVDAVAMRVDAVTVWSGVG